MKTTGDWITLGIVILGVLLIILFCWWLTSTLSVLTCIYITVVLNFIVTVYLTVERYKKNGQDNS